MHQLFDEMPMALNRVPKILLVDGDPDVQATVRQAVGDPAEVTCVADVQQAIGVMETSRHDLVISQTHLEPLDGYALLNWARANYPQVPVVLIASEPSVQAVVRGIHGGAEDVLPTPLVVEALAKTLKAALRRAHAVSVVTGGLRLEDDAPGLIGACSAMLDVYRLIARAARSTAPVLILGESGTGKELVARAIHEHSERTGPFVPVNCGALSDSLLESELFGHLRGAFTGAERPRKGLFAEASAGTLFLDEIGEVSPRLQVQLLRVLQSGEYRPVGADSTRTSDARIVVATHRDLAKAVGEKSFRQDLYYRLRVVDVKLPPLRERARDLPMLVDRFIRLASGPSVSIDEDAMLALQTHDWPGNVRELENVITRAVALSPGPSIGLQDLPPEIRGGEKGPTAHGEVRTLAEVEQDYVRRILKRCGGNKSQAARLLGVDRKTLHRILARAEAIPAPA